MGRECSTCALGVYVHERIRQSVGEGGKFEEFSTLNNFKRTGFVVGCENWGRYDC